MKKSFILDQLDQIKRNPFVLIIKSIKVLWYLPALLIIILVLLIRPIILIRLGRLDSSRLGHFAANTELYLCEKYSGISTKRRLSLDLFYFKERICNKQLYTMWARNIVIMPRYFSFFFIRVEHLITSFSYFFPLFKSHIVKPSLADRDIHGLLSKTPINLKFTKDEIKKGCAELKKIGIPEEAKIVLLCVRDSAYLDNIHKSSDPTLSKMDWTYHNYRDCNIDNFVLVSEQLAEMGYYVLRMGVVVKKPLESNNPMVIDYANNDMRTDFMDIYLASICEFVISTGNGGDCPAVACFRKPCVYVNYCPILYLFTFISNSLAITKHHISTINNKELTFKEIISNNVGACQQSECFEQNGVVLIENTPEEICDVAMEMVEKLTDSWTPMSIDSMLQSTFWDIFPNTKPINGVVLHGEIRMTYGSNFLRKNTWWLE